MESSRTSGSIGVQQILPRTGTSWQGQNPTPAEPSQSAGAAETPSGPDRGATPDGMGQLVDRIV
ncbi:MAG: hypothetical protein K2Y27_34375 [Xanthobacteraceae bacterium]|nr:hypothetical protein [Xanthobacteraceae bacterium]